LLAARAGDRAALAGLVEAFAAWTNEAASQYAAKWGLETKDLAQEGFKTLTAVVRNWKPEKGGVLNLYCYAAGRAMVAYCRKKPPTRPGGDTLDAVPDHRGPDPRAESMGAALDRLPYLQRVVVEQVEGLYGPERSVDAVAAELGRDAEDVWAIYGDALKALRYAVEQAA
jgi:DNA-directed RNA polymerase specialized sigma24 family protein